MEQRRLANQPSKSSLVRRTFLVTISLIVMLSGMFTYTYSFYSDSVENNGNSFSTTHIGNFLRLYPGKAKASFPSLGSPNGQDQQVSQAAGYDGAGELYLDFGELTEGNSANFENILWFENTNNKRLNVSWHVEGEIGSLMDVSQGSFYLLPDAGTQGELSISMSEDVPEILSQQVYGSSEIVTDSTYKSYMQQESLSEYSSPYSFSLKLRVRNAPGVYQGFLVINVDGGFLSAKIPAKVVVRAKKTEEDVAAQSVYRSDSSGGIQNQEIDATKEMVPDQAIEEAKQDTDASTTTENSQPEQKTDEATEGTKDETTEQTTEETGSLVEELQPISHDSPIDEENTVENEEVVEKELDIRSLLEELLDPETVGSFSE